MTTPYRGSSSKPQPNRNRNSAPPQDQKQAAPATEKEQPQQQIPPAAGAGDQAPVVYQLPPDVARRGITEDQWFTLRKSLYPGALPESVVMVWDYCKARRLDPLVHRVDHFDDPAARADQSGGHA